MDWDQRYREKDTPWERGQPAPALVAFTKRQPMRGRVLVPGCGLGNDARYLAAHGCETVGADISTVAIESAVLNSPTELKARLRYQLCDVLDPNNGFPSAYFDWIFEHTCFCTLRPEQRRPYVEAAARMLKPEGHLLAIFFTDLEDDGGPPYLTPKHEIENLFSPSFKMVESWRPDDCFPGREGEETAYLMRKSAGS